MVEQINKTTYSVLATQSLEDLNALLPHPLHRRAITNRWMVSYWADLADCPAKEKKTRVDNYEATITARIGNSIERVKLGDLTVD